MTHILIDAGHGIDTPGKRSPDGSLREYLYNRQIADLLIERFSKLAPFGMRATLVVPETNDVPLRTRAMRVNNICKTEGAGNVLLLSIHANAAGDGSRWMPAAGWECYTSPGCTRSDELAESLYDAFEHAFRDRKIRTDRSDGDKDKEASFYILTKTACPAVLLENFFYDNREECSFMLRQDTKERIADAIVAGVEEYLSEI